MKKIKPRGQRAELPDVPGRKAADATTHRSSETWRAALICISALSATLAYSSIASASWVRVTAPALLAVKLADLESENMAVRVAHLNLLKFARGPISTPKIPERTNDELKCLAQTIYFESRGEPLRGQQAVAHVVMNRMESRHFPNTVCEVVQQGGDVPLNRCQFSWWCDGKSDKPTNPRAWYKSWRLAQLVYSHQLTDPTGGALWYHAEYAAPAWRDAFVRGPSIGQHIFYTRPASATKPQLAKRP